MLRISIVLLALGALLTGPADVSAGPPATHSLTAENPLAQNAALTYWRAFASLPQLDKRQEEAMEEALEQPKPGGKDIEEIFDASAAALKELHRGARMPQCNWGLAFEDGLELLMPHLSKARELSRLACLRAHTRFGQGRVDEAVDDCMAAMTLARHCAGDAVVISLLVDYAIEQQVLRVIARHLPSLKSDELQRLSEKLDCLPSGRTMHDAAITERAVLLEGIIRDLSVEGGKRRVLNALSGEGNWKQLKDITAVQLKRGFESLRPLYDRLAEVVLLPPDEAEQAFNEALKDPGLKDTTRSLAEFMLSAIVSIRRTEAVYQTRLALLRAAIAVAEKGPQALREKELQDPFAAGPLEYTAREGGFTLKSKLLDKKGQPVVLTVGPPTE